MTCLTSFNTVSTFILSQKLLIQPYCAINLPQDERSGFISRIEIVEGKRVMNSLVQKPFNYTSTANIYPNPE